eukprot:gene1399-2001_t
MWDFVEGNRQLMAHAAGLRLEEVQINWITGWTVQVSVTLVFVEATPATTAAEATARAFIDRLLTDTAGTISAAALLMEDAQPDTAKSMEDAADATLSELATSASVPTEWEKSTFVLGYSSPPSPYLVEDKDGGVNEGGTQFSLLVVYIVGSVGAIIVGTMLFVSAYRRHRDLNGGTHTHPKMCDLPTTDNQTPLAFSNVDVDISATSENSQLTDTPVWNPMNSSPSPIQPSKHTMVQQILQRARQQWINVGYEFPTGDDLRLETTRESVWDEYERDSNESEADTASAKIVSESTMTPQCEGSTINMNLDDAETLDDLTHKIDYDGAHRAFVSDGPDSWMNSMQNEDSHTDFLPSTRADVITVDSVFVQDGVIAPDVEVVIGKFNAEDGVSVLASDFDNSFSIASGDRLGTFKVGRDLTDR